MEPPTSLARWWGNGLKRSGGGRRCGVSGCEGMWWDSKTRRMGWLTRRWGCCPRRRVRDALSLGPRQGDALLGIAFRAGAVVGAAVVQAVAGRWLVLHGLR